MKPKIFITTVCIVLVAASTLAQKVYNIKNFGAKGDGETDDAIAIQKAIDACSKTGGKILIPAPYTFMAGPFNIRFLF